MTVVLASGGYPEKYETGRKITGLAEAAALDDVHLFHAGTRIANGDIVTSGGRVLAITALGETLELARNPRLRSRCANLFRRLSLSPRHCSRVTHG